MKKIIILALIASFGLLYFYRNFNTLPITATADDEVEIVKKIYGKIINIIDSEEKTEGIIQFVDKSEESGIVLSNDYFSISIYFCDDLYTHKGSVPPPANLIIRAKEINRYIYISLYAKKEEDKEILLQIENEIKRMFGANKCSKVNLGGYMPVEYYK